MQKRYLTPLCLIGLLLPLIYVDAATIITPHKYAWSNNVGYINFEHVIVSDAALSGYAWSANKGFINFNPAMGGVLNDGAGNLSGSAWGESLGWINFDNVTILPGGQFSGTATGELAGTVTFNCPVFCDVLTDWVPGATPPTPPAPPPSPSPSSGNSGRQNGSTNVNNTSLPNAGATLLFPNTAATLQFPNAGAAFSGSGTLGSAPGETQLAVETPQVAPPTMEVAQAVSPGAIKEPVPEGPGFFKGNYIVYGIIAILVAVLLMVLGYMLFKRSKRD